MIIGIINNFIKLESGNIFTLNILNLFLFENGILSLRLRTIWYSWSFTHKWRRNGNISWKWLWWYRELKILRFEYFSCPWNWKPLRGLISYPIDLCTVLRIDLRTGRARGWLWIWRAAADIGRRYGRGPWRISLRTSTNRKSCWYKANEIDHIVVDSTDSIITIT